MIGCGTAGNVQVVGAHTPPGAPGTCQHARQHGTHGQHAVVVPCKMWGSDRTVSGVSQQVEGLSVPKGIENYNEKGSCTLLQDPRQQGRLVVNARRVRKSHPTQSSARQRGGNNRAARRPKCRAARSSRLFPCFALLAPGTADQGLGGGAPHCSSRCTLSARDGDAAHQGSGSCSDIPRAPSGSSVPRRQWRWEPGPACE